MASARGSWEFARDRLARCSDEITEAKTSSRHFVPSERKCLDFVTAASPTAWQASVPLMANARLTSTGPAVRPRIATNRPVLLWQHKTSVRHVASVEFSRTLTKQAVMRARITVRKLARRVQSTRREMRGSMPNCRFGTVCRMNSRWN